MDNSDMTEEDKQAWEQRRAKVEAEIANLVAQTANLNAHTAKLTEETRWYLLVVGAAFMAAAVAVAKVFL